MACNPKEYDGKGGVIALTRWIEKMESVIDNSGCAENQGVKFAASSFVNKALTCWNTQIQAIGREATVEVVDGKKVEVDRIIRDCKLELGNSLFIIDLIPLGHGSFDVIMGMNWLSK
nr:reverse transcriptase domain-containing protein [Tanacetum cinerariifolium]